MVEAAIQYEEFGGIARITLNRPSRSNAFDLATAQLFARLVDRAADESVRVVLLTGSGKRFCAGGDIASMVDSGLSPAALTELANTLDGALQQLASLTKPTIAAVHGAVAGAGLGLLLSCDLVVAAAATKFLLAYEGVGLTPDCGVSYLLPRVIGQQRALSLALTGRVLSAAEAEQWGLVSLVTDDEKYLSSAIELAESLAARSPFALGQAKRLIRSSYQVSRAESGADEASTIGNAVATSEAATLIAAFVGAR